ncbi:MAG TPA: hypothetical protein VGE89_03160 [Bryobacteraceae bacterium]|jgi:hypothetical protein
MNSATAPESPKLTAATSGFVLAAAIAALFNTALALVRDAYAPLNGVMKSLTGNSWTAHCLADLVLFAGLGLIFTKTRAAEKIDADRLTGALIGAVAIAALGLALWFAFV